MYDIERNNFRSLRFWTHFYKREISSTIENILNENNNIILLYMQTLRKIFHMKIDTFRFPPTTTTKYKYKAITYNRTRGVNVCVCLCVYVNNIV